MVFSSLFGKKRDKQDESKPAAPDKAASARASGAVGPAAGAGSVPTGATAAPGTAAPASGGRAAGAGGPPTVPASALSAREMARATAEKIDRIESEMAKDFSVRDTQPFAAPAATVPGEPRKPAAPPAPAPRRPPAGATTVPSLGQSTDILLGDSILAHAMELSDSASNPAIEEAAILYANGQAMPAAAVLHDAIRAEQGGPSNAAAMQPWLMLFELYQLLGKKAEFESLAIDYAVRFDGAPPAWNDEAVVAAPAPAAERAVIAFQGALDAGIVPLLDQLKRLAQKNRTLWLEFDRVTVVEPAGADLMLRVFAAFQKSSHEVMLQGVSHLADLCQHAVAVGRRDPSNAVWMLLLETYRLLDRQVAFEEAGIDYCVTYEVSPPSWEPPSARFKVDDGRLHQPVPGVESGDENLPSNTLALRGDLVGKLEPELQRLTVFASVHPTVVIDCAHLRRVDFTAAGALLNWAVGMQAAGTPVRFAQVGHLVAALFAVMGLHEVAQIERRSP